MLDKIERILAPLAVKLGNNRELIAIRDGFLVSTPLLIVASIFLVVANFPIPGYSEFVAQLFGQGWESSLDPIINATFSCVGLLGAVGIGYSYGKQLNTDAIAAGAVSLVSFLILAPQVHPTFMDDADKVFKGFAFGNLGSAGLFIAMISALLAVRIFTFVKEKGWVIKLPDGVPPAVTASFAALIPSMFVMFFFLLVPLMNTVLATLATMAGIIPYTTGAALPWTTPLFFSGWLSTGSIVAGLFQIFLVALGCAVYYPFFKVLDKQYLQDETSGVAAEEDDISLDDLSFD